MTGITILSAHQFDIGVNSLLPFVLPNLTGIPIVPGRFWTNAGSSAWDVANQKCGSSGACGLSQYTLSGATVNCTAGTDCASFPPSLMTINLAEVSANFDPIANHVFVGSGPWQCGMVTGSSGSGTCTSTGAQNPPIGGSYTLTRFGNGIAPGSSTSGIYFRSSGRLALFIWACDGAPTITILCYSNVLICYGVPLGVGNCAHYQQGIGASSTGIVGINQVSIVLHHFNDDWIFPYDWANPQSRPLGMATVPPVLYEGSVTLNPASIVGCAAPYPTGGYDC
jgi:hypothetical protein